MGKQPEMKEKKPEFLAKFPKPMLYVIISPCLSKKAPLEILRKVIDGGADAVQLREKTMPDGEFFSLCKEFRKATEQTKTLFIVNDRAKIAHKVDADGLHIGQSDINITDARKIIGHNKILGVSTHTILQARRAQMEGADYIGVGPLYYTPTKNYEPPVGLEYLEQVQREIRIPYIAIGGINRENISKVLAAGGLRVALCSAIICSDSITQATRFFKTRILSGSSK